MIEFFKDNYNSTPMAQKYLVVAPNLTPLANIDIATIKFSTPACNQFSLLYKRALTNTFRTAYSLFFPYLIQFYFAMFALILYYNVLLIVV